MRLMKKFAKDESGQAILEFILLLLAVIAVTGSLKAMLKYMTAKVWALFARKVAAPCPTCDAGSGFDL